ncbi:hypothetical protein BH09SUM1_BH09SUM1_17900 [soil metagenome]
MVRALLAFLVASFFVAQSPAAEITAPVLVKREAVKWAVPPEGKTESLDIGTSTSFTLFIPEKFAADAKGETRLTIHYHGASWFMAQEHTRRGSTNPLLTANAAAGDAVYETDIMKPGVFAKVMAQVQAKLAAAGKPAKVTSIELSSFSGGYSGARGMLQIPEAEALIDRLLLDDSLYSAGDPATIAKTDHRRPRPDAIAPFQAFAKKAVEGKKFFLFEHSSTDTLRSVGPKECSMTIMENIGVPLVLVALDSVPAARRTTDFPLMWRGDLGNAHFLCYTGNNVPIHLSHVRNQAEMWNALDGKPVIGMEPPAMPKRDIKKPDAEAGTLISMDLSTTYTLFLPPGYKPPKNGEVELTLHFHAAEWFARSEHMRRGLDGPLVTCYAGEGSTIYKKQFDDPANFKILLDRVVKELWKRGAQQDTHITKVDITSFSAGYGAVREIVKVPENLALIRRVILADSLYGSLDEKALADQKREVLQEHVDVWLPLAREAMAGNKTFLITCSSIETGSYAASFEVAKAIEKALNLDEVTIAPGSTPAASDPAYAIKTRADKGSLHIWLYDGKDPGAHMTHPRHMAELWAALDEMGDL